VYYGSIDATPLFVMLVGELHRWGLGDDAVRSLLPAVDRALAWIDEYGDLDGDGYVEYRRQNEHGLLNQGWKDSFDSIRFADGRLGEPPIALCEVQGYVYAALIARARIARADGEDQRASGLEARARGLRERFNRDFWLPDRGWIALALDCEKRPVDALTSNIGHCLWTGILYDELAVEVAARLVAPDMFSGWGIRTLSSRSTGYNPASYHNGSVWPHDNAICAAGLARYGMHDAAEQVLTGVVDAAASFDDRLPELFTGLAPDDTPFPVRYPTSCSPQAWAAAAPLMMLRTVLGLEPDVPGGVLQVRPAVPAWMGRVRLAGVPLGDGRLSLEAHTDTVRILEVPPGLTVTDGSPGS
jgi:glycogen debranching enzyme